MHEQPAYSEHERHVDIIWQSDAMRDVIKLAEQVVCSQVSVLIQGENGVGKETIASFIQEKGSRKDKPFIKVRCADLPDLLLESELFGSEEGMSTKTVDHIKGCFELANEGTLFLDEIGKITPYIQAKLLRILQEKKFKRVGGTKILESNVRIISATNANLMEAIKQKIFREDLYYRLNVITISIPPLRERREDIPPLISHFLKIYQKKNNKIIDGISEDVLDILKDYQWPGNIHELKNVMQKVVILTQDNIISKNYLPENIVKNDRTENKGVFIPIGMPLHEIEKKIIIETLKKTKGDKEATADLLGVTPRTIYRKMHSLEEANNRNSDL